ncbi:MAG TPA: class I SAM-dependent methyltransferase [Pyrinomonadaceae bacterium]|nr:class I SAM-dependent methyltransferase [Pyrinomonadaceae bacterium]
MNSLDKLKEVISENRTLRLVEDGIYSALENIPHDHLYDRRAAAYDLVVGTRLYNRLMWGTSPSDYVMFARRAIESQTDGLHLDAGCGSLLFTARAYVESRRQIIAFDQSLEMLRRARKRLLKLSGSAPSNIFLLQADLSDLPFRPQSFSTILCLNVLHQFAEAAKLMLNLKNLLQEGGHIYLTSLVTNNRTVGDSFLNVLYRTGEFVRPRSSEELEKLSGESLNQRPSYRTKGNIAFVEL